MATSRIAPRLLQLRYACISTSTFVSPLARHYTSSSSSRPSSSNASPASDPHPYLSQLGSQTPNASFGANSNTSPHIGPFPLPHDSRESQIRAAQMKWAELGTGQKLGVASVWTGSLIVVLAGGVLAVVVLWSTGSELWSEASPTRIFEDATERVKESEELKTLLIPPLSFHGSNSSNRLRRNRRISHQIIPDPTGQGQDVMRVQFWVEAHDPASDTEDYWTKVKRFVGVAIWEDSRDPGSFVSREEKEHELLELQKVKEQERVQPVGWGQWITNSVTGAFRGLVPRNSAVPGEKPPAIFKRARKPNLGEHSTAEVVAELKKDPNTGAFVYQTLTAYLPDTRHPNKYRVDIPTANVGEPTKGLDRLRFWNRKKTVLT